MEKVATPSARHTLWWLFARCQHVSRTHVAAVPSDLSIKGVLSRVLAMNGLRSCQWSATATERQPKQIIHPASRRRQNVPNLPQAALWRYIGGWFAANCCRSSLRLRGHLSNCSTLIPAGSATRATRPVGRPAPSVRQVCSGQQTLEPALRAQSDTCWFG
jgi:hypothetical protein